MTFSGPFQPKIFYDFMILQSYDFSSQNQGVLSLFALEFLHFIVAPKIKEIWCLLFQCKISWFST